VIPLWLVVLLALAGLALFAGLEAALTALSRIRLRQWVGKQISSASGKALLERPHQLIWTVFVGDNVVTVLLAVTATLLAARYLAPIETWPVLGLLMVLALATPPAVLIGEVLPRAAVRRYPARLVPPLFAAARFFRYVFWPYVKLMDAFAGLLFGVFGLPRPNVEHSFTRDSVDALLREGEREGLVERHEREIIGGIFSFGEKTVREVMTPRTDVVAVQLGSSREEIARLIWETGFSRFPVTDGSPENVVGIVHAVDVLKARQGERLRIRPTLVVPETMRCDELLFAMRRQHLQLAVVVDEYGGIAGIVTMEDLVEELVGEIRDEHDREATASAAVGAEAVLVDGRTRLGEAARELSVTLSQEEAAETVAGHLLRRLGRVPGAGETVTLRDLAIEVVEATPRRIVRAKVTSVQGAGNG